MRSVGREALSVLRHRVNFLAATQSLWAGTEPSQSTARVLGHYTRYSGQKQLRVNASDRCHYMSRSRSGSSSSSKSKSISIILLNEDFPNIVRPPAASEAFPMNEVELELEPFPSLSKITLVVKAWRVAVDDRIVDALV